MVRSSLEKYWPWLSLLGIISLNFLLKLWDAGAASIYLDEGASIFFGLKDAEEFQAIMKQDASPPLYYSMLRGWMHWVGDDVADLRALSVIFSAFAAGGVYGIGRRFFSEFAGIVGALLFTFSNLQFQYAQEIRCFALLGFLCVVSSYFFLGVLRDRKHTDFVGLMVVNLLIAGTHYVALPLLVVQGVVALALAPFDVRRTIRYGLSQLPLLLFGLLFVLQDVNDDKLENTGSWLNAPSAKMILQMLGTFSGTENLASIMLLVVAVGAVFLVLRSNHHEPRMVLALWAWPLLGLLVAWGVSQWMPFFIAKYLAFLGIGWVLSVAVALDLLPLKRWGKWGMGLALLVGALIYFRPHKVVLEDWKQAASEVQARKQGGGVIITPVYQLKTFAYYYDRAAFRDGKNLFKRMQAQKIYSINKLDQGFFEYQDDERWILIQSHHVVTDPKRESREVLKKRMHQKAFFQLKGLEISIFEGRKGGSLED